MTKSVEIFIRIRSKLGQQLATARKHFKRLARVAKRVAIGMRRAWADVGRVMQFLGRQMRRVLIVATIFAAHMAQKFVRGVITAGAEAEMFGKQMMVAFGNIPKMAQEAMDWVRKFAERTPHYTQEVVRSFIMLKNLGVKNVKETVTAAGDAASAMMRPITDVAMAFGSLLARTWRRLGVHIDRTGKKAIIMTNRIRKEVDNNLTAVRQALLEVTQVQFGGTMKKMESAWFGMLRIMSSVWWEFKVQIAEAGVFQFVSNGLQMILDKADELRKTGELEDWAIRISDEMIDLANVFADLYDKIRKVYLGFKITGQRLASFGALSVIVGAKIAKYTVGLENKEAWDQSTIIIRDFQIILRDLKDDIDDTVTEFGKLGTVGGGTYKLKRIIDKLKTGLGDAKKEAVELRKELSNLIMPQRGLTELGKSQASLVTNLTKMTGEQRDKLRHTYDIMKRITKEQFAEDIYLQRAVTNNRFLSATFADHVDFLKEKLIKEFTSDKALRERLRLESGLETAAERLNREINARVLKEIQINNLLGNQRNLLIEQAEIYKKSIIGGFQYGKFPETPERVKPPGMSQTSQEEARRNMERETRKRELTPRQKTEAQGLTVVNSVQLNIKAEEIAKKTRAVFKHMMSNAIFLNEESNRTFFKDMQKINEWKRISIEQAGGFN